jgi:hypothetical protein
MIICTRKCFEHFVAIDSIKALFFIIIDALHLHILSGTSLAVAVAFATTTTPSSKKVLNVIFRQNISLFLQIQNHENIAAFFFIYISPDLFLVSINPFPFFVC